MPSQKPNQQRDITARRQRLAALRLAGVRDQCTLAATLQVSQPTVSRDLAWLDAQFRQAAAQDIATAKGQDLERIEELILAIWTEAKTGKLIAIDRVVKLLERKARLLGYDSVSPLQVDVVHLVREMAVTEGLTPEETEAAVREAERMLREWRH